jgi:uncharacterized membrane protein
MSRVSALRLAYLLGLCIWIGGLFALGTVVAPTAFAVLQTRIPGTGRILAGSVFGAMLERFHLVAALCGVLMLASLLVMALVGPRPRPYGGRLSVIATMLVVTLVLALPIGRGIRRLQLEAGDRPIASLPEHDARRIAFNRLHGTSNVLLLANLAGGLLLLFWEARR